MRKDEKLDKMLGLLRRQRNERKRTESWWRGNFIYLLNIIVIHK